MTKNYGEDLLSAIMSQNSWTNSVTVYL
jgi:hypothetical protein